MKSCSSWLLAFRCPREGAEAWSRPPAIEVEGKTCSSRHGRPQEALGEGVLASLYLENPTEDPDR